MDVSKMDGLDDFEKSLAADKAQRERDEDRRERKHKHRRHRDGDDERRSDRDRDRDRSDRDRHQHRHHRHKHGDHGADDGDGHRDEHRHKRSRREYDDKDGDKGRSERRGRTHRDEDGDTKRRHGHEARDVKEDLPLPDEEKPASQNAVESSKSSLARDSWMTAPSSLDIDYIHRPRDKSPPPPTKEEPKRAVHARELNAHLNDERYIDDKIAAATAPGERKVNYTFGDDGSSWRMTRLRGVFAAAEQTGKAAEDIALQRYGSLEEFDDAREEKEELERRRIYGPGHDNKEKPSGELHQERLREMRKGQAASSSSIAVQEIEQGAVIPDEAPTVVIDQTALNRLRAQMMKAKLRRAPNAAQLEQEYNRAAAALASGASLAPSSNLPPGAVVVGAMESRLLAGQRGEVKAVQNRRGRERGNVEENEDMSIEDMVREERRTRNQAGGEGLRQAERIAKDGKYTDDLDYMDDNAAKLARRVHKNEASLKSMAIGDLQRLNRALDNCPLCHHEDASGQASRGPVAPVVSLAMRSYLTLPPEPEVSPGGALIVPTTHRRNLLECDDDEWEELRNFMKSLTRLYHAQGREVLFYENAAASPGSHRHAALAAVPIPYDEGAMAPAHFKEAFLSSDAEWSQHRPIIDTQRAATEGGLGRAAFRRSIAKEMPYFHVWLTLDGGLGHIVEDGGGRWPKGDLFAREVIGGIVSAEPHIVKKQGRWQRGQDGPRVEAWKRDWRKYDWTRVLAEEA